MRTSPLALAASTSACAIAASHTRCARTILGTTASGTFPAVAGTTGVSGRDDERPHHVVVFVLDDVAMMNIALRRVHACR
jgi:hypothetical protein